MGNAEVVIAPPKKDTINGIVKRKSFDRLFKIAHRKENDSITYISGSLR